MTRQPEHLDTGSMQERLTEALRAYFHNQVSHDPPDAAQAKLAWRMQCYQSGLDYVQFLEESGFPIHGKQVLDVACAWGGHISAFAAHGARVTGAELLDHQFGRLAEFYAGQNLEIRLCLSNCEYLPIKDQSQDVILAFELIEHIESVDRFAAEVARVLRPGGLCLLSTPARFRSVVDGEPHYGLRGLALLPFFVQGPVARRLFGRCYPYPIARQYARAQQIVSPFEVHGLKGRPVLHGRLSDRLKNRRGLLRLATQYLWQFVVIEKPEA